MSKHSLSAKMRKKPSNHRKQENEHGLPGSIIAMDNRSDYTANGAYFITIRSDQHQTLFVIPELHKILQETWNNLPERFPGIELDEFVIMPDHIHFIIWLNKTEQKAPTLWSVVGAYKSIAAVAWIRHIETNNLIQYTGHIWQKGYHEHVIRISELEQTRLYIRNNPIHRPTPLELLQPLERRRYVIWRLRRTTHLSALPQNGV